MQIVDGSNPIMPILNPYKQVLNCGSQQGLHFGPHEGSAAQGTLLPPQAATVPLRDCAPCPLAV